MKNKRLVILILLFAILILPSITYADVGGGLDWDSDNWSIDDDFNSGWDYDDYDDYDYNNYGNGSNFFYWGGGGLSGGLTPIEAVIIVVVLIIIFNNIRKKDNKSGSGGEYKKSGKTSDNKTFKNKVKDEDDGYTIDMLKEKDPGFSEGEMVSWVNNVFIQLQNAWTEKDWMKVRPYESDGLFNTHKKQLEQYINKGQTNVVEDIAILSTEFENYKEDSSNEYLSYIIKARYKDYVIEDETNVVVKGSLNQKYLMEYRVSFMRTLNSKTERSEKSSDALSCPNCGAPISINESGVCDYCGSYVTSGQYSWILYQLEPLSQNKI